MFYMLVASIYCVATIFFWMQHQRPVQVVCLILKTEQNFPDLFRVVIVEFGPFINQEGKLGCEYWSEKVFLSLVFAFHVC